MARRPSHHPRLLLLLFPAILGSLALLLILARLQDDQQQQQQQPQQQLVNGASATWAVVDQHRSKPFRQQQQPQQQQPSQQEQGSEVINVSLRAVLDHLAGLDDGEAAVAATASPTAAASPTQTIQTPTFHDVQAACGPHDTTTVWEEWRACVEDKLSGSPTTTNNMSSSAAFDMFVEAEAPRLPWSLASSSGHTAVLLEFRPLVREMERAVGNIVGNLPVHWRVQIVGGPAVCALAQQLFPAEVAAGKIVATDLGIGDYMQQHLVSRVLTDLDLFYSRLRGDTWLFFQYDSAICSLQRHKLATFLDKGYGWWGAPWVHWDRLPEMCGNGGFSLRRRVFVKTILSTFPWNSQHVSSNEDWHICQRAADLYPELLARNDPRLLPAPKDEALAFSVESLFHPAPFGVHQVWTYINRSNASEMRTLFHHCPEALQTLPGDILALRPDWREALCGGGGGGGGDNNSLKPLPGWAGCGDIK